jgi:hypothetical protein
VRPDPIGGGLRIGKVLPNRRGMQALDVIEFDEGVDDQLPVGLAQYCVLAKEPVST